MTHGYLALNRLTKEYRSGKSLVRAVDSIDLEVNEGELVTLLGPSGCGKTTTLRMISGFQTPTSGDIYIDGEKMNWVPPNKRPTAMVFQNYALFPHLSVFDNIAYGLRVRHESREVINRKVQDVMSLVGLSGLEKRAPGELSGGQQQRVSLGRSLVMEPKVLLLDEPLSNLDAKLRISMRMEIRKLQQRVGITTVYVTHDQEEAMTLSDRVVIMFDGRIQQVGSPREIYARPTSRFVAGFIGKANFLESRVDEVRGDRVAVGVAGQKLEISAAGREYAAGDRVLILLRPESVTIGRPATGHIPGTIAESVYLGSQVLYGVRVGDQIISVEEADPEEREIFAVGESVAIQLRAGNLHLLPFEEEHS
ncbi:MAG TPA: ABC transporter ATP-binding protein [Spirochaetia bacterium]|nr:ABC transporter ATP-binding protein [Spirochaetia bacterium]